MLFNIATGSPFKFNVLDSGRVTTRGDGIESVECNRQASFVVVAPEAQLADLDVVITGWHSQLLLLMRFILLFVDLRKHPLNILYMTQQQTPAVVVVAIAFMSFYAFIFLHPLQLHLQN